MEWYNEVFDIVFPEIDRQKANTCKICEWKKENGKDDSKDAEEDD